MERSREAKACRWSRSIWPRISCRTDVQDPLPCNQGDRRALSYARWTRRRYKRPRQAFGRNKLPELVCGGRGGNRRIWVRCSRLSVRQWSVDGYCARLFGGQSCCGANIALIPLAVLVSLISTDSTVSPFVHSCVTYRL